MTDHPPETSVAGQGDSPQNKEPTEAIAETAREEKEEGDKDNEETQQDIKEKGKDKDEDEDEDDDDDEEEEEEGEEHEEGEEESAPPLPDEVPPPLPNEAPPGEDDGWEPVWDGNVQAYYFYNRFTRVSQWENPRVPDPSTAEVPSALGDDGDGDERPIPRQKQATSVVGGYNPAIHGDYDPTAPYAQQYEQQEDGQSGSAGGGGTGNPYEATGYFNRFTGKWQAASLQPENYNDENKSHRQMSAFFDVDAVSGGHDGRSLRAERSAKKLSKKELKAFKDKRREKKEEKRRAWLRD